MSLSQALRFSRYPTAASHGSAGRRRKILGVGMGRRHCCYTTWASEGVATSWEKSERTSRKRWNPAEGLKATWGSFAGAPHLDFSLAFFGECFHLHKRGIWGGGCCVAHCTWWDNTSGKIASVFPTSPVLAALPSTRHQYSRSHQKYKDRSLSFIKVGFANP